LYEAVCSRLGKANVQISDFELWLDSVHGCRPPACPARTCYKQQIQSPGDLELGDLASRVDNLALWWTIICCPSNCINSYLFAINIFFANDNVDLDGFSRLFQNCSLY
jgi:hypothetical protein